MGAAGAQQKTHATSAPVANAQAPRDTQPVAAPERDETAICYGFAFGKWTPALDWAAAGHGARPESSRLLHAPDGRDWASDVTTARDTVLMLYPGWWPAGVMVRLPKLLPAQGDTLSGTATALVADGRAQSPAAKVRAWAVPCGEPRAASAH